MARLDRILRARLPVVGRAACIAALATLLSSCNRDGVAKHSGEVLAKVNDREITLDQLKVAADAMGGADTSALVDSLVDEELLVQKALASRLDRDATVIQEIERARRQILARSYEERSVLPHSEISVDARKEYYHANPALFAHRRIYRTLTFSIARSGLTRGLREALDHARSAIQVRELLDRHHIIFEAVETTRAAEEIPITLLPQLAKAAPGDVLIASPPLESRATLICVVEVRDSPVDFEHANGPIRQYLTDVRNREVAAEYLRRARSGAKISYVGVGRGPAEGAAHTASAAGSGPAAPVASAGAAAKLEASSLD